MATKTKKTKSKETPLMQQYNTIKVKHPDALLLFRVGDFYEMFGADAIKAAGILGIVLTARNNGGSKLELAGFPYHSLNTYLPKLVRAGQRVAICEQLEDPKQTKKIVKRGVTELVTPGISYNDNVLDNKKNNFLASVHITKKVTGVAFLDVSTGEFLVAEGTAEYVDKLLQSFQPSEVLVQRQKLGSFNDHFTEKFLTYCMEDWAFTADYANDLLNAQFGTKSLKGFGINKLDHGIIAAGAAISYLKETHNDNIKHVSKIGRIEEANYVWLDRFTIRNLELFHSPNEGAKTLMDILDCTKSPMGARMLKRWLALPLMDKAGIKARHDGVEHMLKKDDWRNEVSELLMSVGDLERLISKVAVGKANPKELNFLHQGLSTVPSLIKLMKSAKSLAPIASGLDSCDFVLDAISNQLQEEAPVLVSKGNVIKTGVNAELDELRKIAFSGKDYLLQLQQRESERTGITSLKIGFNNVFGYYLEVTHSHKDKVPAEWIRKQTLVNAERYITEELKDYETKILGAEEKIQALEAKLFHDLVISITDYIQPIQKNAQIISELDCILSFALLAKQNGYTRPKLNEKGTIELVGARHPVIEQQLPLGDEYVPNDITLNQKKQQIIMITGPNMAGKSALLRQTALISIMAQMGSFVPAESANLMIVDKIFTRVGASDNISMGESTFMVEMNETASILNNLSDNSLVLLDEIGRGTSTYDGISIAWAIAEYIHENKFKAKTLFATHYHELNEMSKTFKRIKNYNVAVKEIENRIIFLRKLVAGGSEHSFGIHVAKMAGMPKQVLQRANQILEKLEEKNGAESTKQTVNEDDMQLSFFQLDDPVLSQIKEEIENLDINTLTPVEALMKLNEIKKLTGAK